MALLLTILKIIGIVLLVIIGIVLLFLLLVMFIPIVYKAEGKKQKLLCLKAKVSWFFPLLYGNISYDESREQKLLVGFYLLGIPIYREKNKKTERKNNRKAGKKTDTKRNTETNRQNDASQTYQADTVDIAEHTFVSDTAKKSTDMENSTADRNSDGTVFLEKEAEKKGLIRGFVEKVRDCLKSVRLFFKKVFEKVRNIKYTVLSVKQKLLHIKETIGWYLEVLDREESRQAIEKCRKQIARLFRHIKPQKLRGNVVFGFEDPSATGEVLAIISMFYPLYGNHINIVPVFDETVFTGDFLVKGRVRLFSILRIGFGIFFDKNVRNLYNILTGGRNHE